MTAAKPRVARVEILWSENSRVPKRAFPSLAAADAALARAFAADPPPAGGAYDKTAFLVVWTDGQRHEGRADVRAQDVRSAPAAGGILRQHLEHVGRWMRDKSATAEWLSDEQKQHHAEWGADLLARLAEMPTTLDQRNSGEVVARAPTLLPYPNDVIAQLRHRFRTREHTGAAVRYATNYVSLALGLDLAMLDPGSATAIWNEWRRVVDDVKQGLAAINDRDRYPSHETFWKRDLPAVGALLEEAMDSGGTLRNGRLNFRPVGARDEPYPAWIQDLRGRSGVYVIRERQPDGTMPIVYVGESHTDRLHETLTRHFQTWRRWKTFWRGGYTEGHDPGLSYERAACEAAVIVTHPNHALEMEARLIRRLRPRDNLIGQADDAEAAPF